MRRKRTGPFKKRRFNQAVLACLLSVAVCAGDPALGQTPTVPPVVVNDGTGEYANLGAAVNSINDETTAGNLPDPTVTINTNQTVSGTQHLYGGYDGGNKPFTSVTVGGGAVDSLTTISGAGAMTGGSRLMTITNVTDNITVENLVFDGQGRVSGLYVGGAAANSTPSSDPPFAGYDSATPATIQNFQQLAINKVTFKNHQNARTSGGAVSAGLEVWNFGPSWSLNGKAALTGVTLTGNEAAMVSGAASTGSAQGGGGRIAGLAEVVFSAGSVTGNQARVENGSHAHGGGLVISGNGSSGNLDVTISGSSFSNNLAQVSGDSSSGNAVARGGGLYLSINTDTTAVTGTAKISGNFSGNQAVASDQTGAVYNAALGGGAAVHGDIDSTFSGSFRQNQAISDGEAKGGALASLIQKDSNAPAGALNLSGANFSLNTVNGGTDARGGAVYAEGALAMNNALASGNTATSSDGVALGGAVYSTQTADINGGRFESNQAVTQAAASAQAAMGGALYAVNGADIQNAAFTGNQALASGSGGSASARGGAVYQENGAVSAVGATFSGNRAAAQAGQAQGGAIFLSQGTHTITDSNFLNNTATAADPAGQAQGGAIFVDTKASGASTLNLTASAGTMTFEGNKANGESSGLHFGRSNGADSAAGAALNLAVAEAAAMKMFDALSVDMNNGQDFAMTKTGAGTLEWSGANRMSVDGGTAAINLNEGTTVLDKDFSLAVADNTQLNFNANAQSTIKFDTTRDPTKPVFDIAAGATGAQFNVESGAVLEVAQAGRELFDRTESYFLVDDHGNTHTYFTDLNNITFGQNLTGSTFDEATGNLNLKYTSEFTGAIKAAGANTVSGASELARVVKLQNDLGQHLVSDSELAVITNNFRAATAEYGAAAGRQGISVTRLVADRAVRDLKREYGYSLPAPLYQQQQAAYGEAREGARLWGAYLGNFSTVDSTGGYYGYDQDTNGGLIGLSYDRGPTSSLGLYAGVTRNKQKFDSLASRNEAGGVHLGVTGRFSPAYDFDPNVALYGDLGYAAYDNEGKRYLGGEMAQASFDQKLVTIGLGAEYVADISPDVRLTPSLDLRYTRLDQDGFQETGFAPILNSVDGYTAKSFTSLLALSASTEIPVTGGAVSPMVRVGWRHEYGDRNYQTMARYSLLGAAANRFRLSTHEVDRDALEAGLGLRAMLESGPQNQVGLNLNYDVSVSKNVTDQSVYGGLEYRF